MATIKRYLWGIAATALLCSVTTAGVTGDWVSYDDKSGKKKSIVRITRQGDTISGKIIKLFNPSHTTCVACKGKLHNKPIVGMTIFSGLKKRDGVWQGGKILDPKNGKRYECKIWEEGNRLKVRGYLMMFYRTQTWRRH